MGSATPHFAPDQGSPSVKALACHLYTNAPNLSSDLSLETEARGGQTFLLGQILDAVCGQHAQSGTQRCPCASPMFSIPENE